MRGAMLHGPRYEHPHAKDFVVSIHANTALAYTQPCSLPRSSLAFNNRLARIFPWYQDKEIVVSATTAAIAGGCAGTAYSVVRVPMKWVTDPVLSCGRGLKSREFMTHLARSAMRQSLPNALAFVAIEVFLHYSGVH